jgi:hypothetical protein
MRISREAGIIKEAELIRTCATSIRAVLGNAAAVKESHRNTPISIKGPWGTISFALQPERRITTHTIRPLIARIRQTGAERPLVLSEYIGPEIAKILREEKINFADAAGNLSLDAPPLFVWQHGFKRNPPVQRPLRAFQVAGLKILSVLLWEPAMMDATYRVLAEKSGVSLGAIVPVIRDLTEGGYLRTTKTGPQLIRRRELLDHWVLGYAGQLFPRLILRTCRLAGSQPLEKLRAVLRDYHPRDKMLLGGELAAGMATGYLRPVRAAIHLAPEILPACMQTLKLIPDAEGNVDLLQRFGHADAWTEPPVALEGFRCANPILLYGELLRMGTDDRLRETAALLFQKHIASRFGEDR